MIGQHINYSFRLVGGFSYNQIMNKAGLTIAQKIAQLRHIPPQMLPSTLRHNLQFPKFAEIKFEYAKFAKEIGPMLQFYRLYIADLRHHNPELSIVRQAKPEGPIIGRVIIKVKESRSSDIVLEGGKFNSVEDMKQKLRRIHNQLV